MPVVILGKMNSFLFLILFPTLWVSLSAFAVPLLRADSPSLRLVHVLFRHGHRNPDSGSLMDSNPFSNESFYPEGFGQLTNAGKRREYEIGLRLRKRYNKFLTDTWNINYLEARSTDTNRTKMSLELLLAGLYPPKKDQVWSQLPWQPIPYNYYPTSEDKETQPWVACSNFWSMFSEASNTPEALKYLQRYDELFAILGNQLGVSDVTLFTAFRYYFGFVTQKEVGYPLEEWTKAIYPEPYHSAAVDYYYFLTNTTANRRLASGFLLKKILSDTKAKIKKTITPSSRKMFFYSGHEMNVGSMLLSLSAYKLTDVPPYGSHVIFEVHETAGIWGIQLFYQNYENDEPIPLRIPGCTYFCPFNRFYSLVEDIIPESDDICIS